MKALLTLSIFAFSFGIYAVDLELAEEYRDFEWTVNQANIDSHQQPNGHERLGYTINYPCDWVDSVGVTIKGMPYHFGGKNTFAQWIVEYDSAGYGPGAHYAHYRRDSTCSLSWAAGIDCSGFVGRCWGIPEAEIDTCGCGYLRRHSQEVTPQQIQPGDIFHRSDHVILCHSRVEESMTNQLIYVIEATSGSFNKVIGRDRLYLTLQQQNFTIHSQTDSTNITSGSVSGTWTLENGPYIINGDIQVDTTSTLSIEAGVTDVEAQVDDLKQKAEEPKSLKLDAQAALGVIRYVMLNLSSLKSVIDGVVGKANDLLNASLKQRQAVTLTNIAFGEQSESMQEFASRMQSVTNHGDEELLPLMAKMRQTFKMTTDEVQAITPYILDFADANASTDVEAKQNKRL